MLMPLAQVSVFVENKPRRLMKIVSLLELAEVEIFALSIAEAGEFGFIRLIVNKPKLAYKTIKEAGFVVSEMEVIAVPIKGDVTISRVTNLIGDNLLNIEYAYSSAVSINGNPVFVLRIDEVQRAEQILRDNGIQVLNQAELQQE